MTAAPSQAEGHRGRQRLGEVAGACPGRPAAQPQHEAGHGDPDAQGRQPPRSDQGRDPHRTECQPRQDPARSRAAATARLRPPGARLPPHDEQGQRHQHERQHRRRRAVEARPVAGVDHAGERVEAQQRDGAEVRQHVQGHEQPPCCRRGARLRERGLDEGPDRTAAQRPGHLLDGGVRTPQGRRDREVDVRRAAQREHREGRPEAGEARLEGQPRVGRDIGRHRERKRGEDAQHTAAGQVAADHEPGLRDPQHEAGERDRRGQPDAGGDQLQRSGAQQDLRDPLRSRLERAQDEVDQRQQGQGRDQAGDGDQRGGGALPGACPRPRRGQGCAQVSPSESSNSSVSPRDARSDRSRSGPCRSASGRSPSTTATPSISGYSNVSVAK